MDKCVYCQKEANVEAFRNPYTKEIRSTCEQCKKRFTSFAKERSFYTKACMWIPLFIVGTIVLMFFNWQLGLIGLIAFIVLEIIAINLQSYYIRKKEIACGTYVDPKSVRWCKTCLHYKKVKKYDDIFDGIWKSEQLPCNANIPCKIIDNTIDVWQKFFLDSNKKTLFPKNCPKWTKR